MLFRGESLGPSDTMDLQHEADIPISSGQPTRFCDISSRFNEDLSQFSKVFDGRIGPKTGTLRPRNPILPPFLEIGSGAAPLRK
jgi:hypothetical protein